jgi:hypothetical protein
MIGSSKKEVKEPVGCGVICEGARLPTLTKKSLPTEHGTKRKVNPAEVVMGEVQCKSRAKLCARMRERKAPKAMLAR